MKKIIIGMLAHVDAGKTTLTESMLYLSGAIRKLGRVDHKDAFLDYDAQERNRGITIFSKQASFQYQNCEVTMIDTPGHVDFSAEMERTLQVLDYAILLINSLDGIQAHSETIWQLLKHYQIPTFIFVNKMDITHYDKAQLMKELEQKLDHGCIDFSVDKQERDEKISLCDDALLERYLQDQNMDEEMISEMICQRKIFPCYFGSALKLENVDDLLKGLLTYTKEKAYPQEFGAIVYKITHDAQGNRLTHMKITGGSLKVKTKLMENEKVDQLRKYSGSKFVSVEEVFAGEVCAVKGLRHIFLGEGLGMETNSKPPVLSSYMNYHIKLAKKDDVHVAYKNLVQLAQEDPQLHVHYHTQSNDLSIQLMGEVQIEVLKQIVKERFNMDIDFDEGRVIYKESIIETIEGVGHYEPLRHYAGVHLLLEPAALGSGIQFSSACLEDTLAKHWQRLIRLHVCEKEHLGVLTGSPITDIKITLLAGKAHLKHTEGGDFREATYRAIRQGLKATRSILLEPYYHFRLEVPTSSLSKAIYDLELMKASFHIQDRNGASILEGKAPVAKMQNYQSQLITYTKGKGKLFCILKGYEPVREDEMETIIAKINYDSERDVENPTGSIFCKQGAGFYVPWDKVYEYMHMKACWQKKEESNYASEKHNKVTIDEKELARVMERTYGVNKSKLRKETAHSNEVKKDLQYVKRLKPCLLVDGYNMIHSWDLLKEIANDHLDAARHRLIHLLSSYQGFKKCLLILVFDAYQVEDSKGTSEYNGSIHIIYTKKAQTADSYIEKASHDLSDQYQVSVATSDGLEQLIVLGQKARRISSQELEKEVLYLTKTNLETYEKRNQKGFHQPLAKLRKLNED